MPVRVKRLSLPIYRYDNVDLDHLDIVLAKDRGQNIMGIAAWEHTAAKELPAGSKALSLHGIYVDPSHHRHGIGSKVFRVVEEAVRSRGFDGLPLKAQQGANGFLFHRKCNACRLKMPCTSTRTVSGRAQPAW